MLCLALASKLGKLSPMPGAADVSDLRLVRIHLAVGVVPHVPLRRPVLGCLRSLRTRVPHYPWRRRRRRSAPLLCSQRRFFVARAFGSSMVWPLSAGGVQRQRGQDALKAQPKLDGFATWPWDRVEGLRASRGRDGTGMKGALRPRLQTQSRRDCLYHGCVHRPHAPQQMRAWLPARSGLRGHRHRMSGASVLRRAAAQTTVFISAVDVYDTRIIAWACCVYVARPVPCHGLFVVCRLACGSSYAPWHIVRRESDIQRTRSGDIAREDRCAAQTCGV